MKRLGVALATLLMAALLLQGNASASRGIEWCAEDPVFKVLGSTFEITTWVNAPADTVSQIAYVVEVPANAGKVKVSYPGGKPIPTTVQILYTEPAYGENENNSSGSADDGNGSFRVRVSVTVTGPAGRVVEAGLAGKNVTPATFTGETNKTFSFQFDVTHK